MVGNSKNYDAIDILRLFLKLNGRTSRYFLSNELDIGEGSIKGMLKELSKKDLIKSTNKGHTLTKKGEKKKIQFNSIVSEIKRINLEDFKGPRGNAVVLSGCNRKISYQDRDNAIRSGADAALLFRYNKGLFLAQCEQGLIDTKSLDNLFSYNKNDILLVVFANNKKTIEKALLNMATKLNPQLTL